MSDIITALLATRGSRALAVLTLAVVAALTTAAASQPPERPGVDYPLGGVVSVCDQFGNRVYRSGGANTAGVAVSPADVSCVKPVIR